MTLKLGNVKAVVKDMVSKKAKFGNYEASKESLDKKYKYKDKIQDGMLTRTYYDRNGKKTACTYTFDRIICDYTSKCDEVMYTGTDGDTFNKIVFEIDGLSCFVEDTNHNGIVDKDDEVTVSALNQKHDAKNEKTLTISVFLGK